MAEPIELTPEQHARLESLDWVMYVTEDGEEYFGQVGTDHTQWDCPEQLTEADIDLLRIAMVDIEEEEEATAMAASGETFGDDAETVEETAAVTYDTSRQETEETSANKANKEEEEEEEKGGVSNDHSTKEMPSDNASTIATTADVALDLPLNSTSSGNDDNDNDNDSQSSARSSVVSRSSTLSSTSPSSLAHRSSMLRLKPHRRTSLHPVPSFRRPSTLQKTLSALDIQKARQATGRHVQTVISPNRDSSGNQGLRRALEVMSDEEIRNVLTELGEEDKSAHAFTRNDMINIVFDGSRTTSTIVSALGSVTKKRNINNNNNNNKGGGGSIGASSDSSMNNSGEFKSSRHLKSRSSSSALGMSRHSSFKTSTGAARVGICEESDWSSEAISAVEALSRVARDVLCNTPGFDTHVANTRSAMPELLRDIPIDKDLSTTTASVRYVTLIYHDIDYCNDDK